MRRSRNGRRKGSKLRGAKLARFRRRIRAAFRRRHGKRHKTRATRRRRVGRPRGTSYRYRLGAAKRSATRRRKTIRSSAQAALCGLARLPGSAIAKRIARLRTSCVTPGLRAGLHGPVQKKSTSWTDKFASYTFNRGGRRSRRNYSTWIPDFGYNPYWVPSYANNPGITSAFSKDTLFSTLPVLGGVVGNAVLTRKIGDMLPFASSGVGSYLAGLASAGLLGAGVGAVSPRLGAGVFFGGVIEVVTKIIKGVTGSMSGMGSYNLGYPGMGYWISQNDAVTSELVPFEYAAPISHDVVENVVAGEAF